MLCWCCWNNWYKIYVPIVTLSAEDNAKLSKLLSEGLARSVYWNNYKIIDNIEVNINNANEEKHCFKKLFVFDYDYTAGNNQVSIDSFKKIFFQELK